MDEISPELVERMADKFRELARVDPEDTGTYFAKNWVGVAVKIVEKLPKPIDPDLIEARKIVAWAAESRGLPSWADSVRTGEQDDNDEVKIAAWAIKRGRELAGGAA